MNLCLASHRAMLKALQAFEDGELALVASGRLAIATPAGELQLVDGVCFAAPCASWIGAELVGWLEELPGLSGVGAWWRPGLAAVLRLKDGRLALSPCAQDLTVDGMPVSSGFATHSARFIVAHGDATTPAAAPAPLAATLVSPQPAPVTPRTPVPHRAPVRMSAPTEASEEISTLRDRGTWRTTAVMPWNLGNGVPVTRGPREPYGPLPKVTAPPRPPVYISTSPSVHMPERAQSSKRAQSSTAISRVA